jgi:hypothetical protein
VPVARYDLDDLDDLDMLGYHAVMSPHTDREETADSSEGLDSTAKVVSLLADYGQHWQIDRQVSPTAWVAVRRCQPPVVEVHCALTIDELRAKLERAAS